MNAYAQDYIRAQERALASIPADAVDRIILHFQTALREDRQVFVFGNGGSASNASHFITDLGKSSSDHCFRRFRCLSLNENLSWITAIGNDYAYEDVYLRQLQNYARPGDTVMVLSVSGSSPNLVKAVAWAKEQGLHTIALVGGKRGTLGDLADTVVVIDDTHYGRVEDCQMHICHMICYAFIEHPDLGKEE
ncbi:MAG TPA: SIS domain-containing protein [Chitinophagaceae bacterium]|jgi:D-sedoheptulose 7-phosphate isomerase|nr:SIS domain-containing protein [Chitinophagaceae bacterium]